MHNPDFSLVDVTLKLSPRLFTTEKSFISPFFGHQHTTVNVEKLFKSSQNGAVTLAALELLVASRMKNVLMRCEHKKPQ